MKPLSTQAREKIGHWSLALRLGFAAIGAFAATGTFAAEPSGPEQWTFGADVYLWGAGIGGTTTSGGDIDITFSDLINNFDMGFMGVMAASKGKWTVMADVIYLNVSEDNNGSLSIPVGSRIAISDKVNVKLKAWVPTLTAHYQLIDNDKVDFHLLGGVRYLWLESDIKLTTYGPLKTRSAKVSDSGGNLDGIVGLRGKFKINDQWYLPFYADIGTGSSELTWQLFGGVGYSFKRFDAVLGYRYMDYEFDDSPVFDNLNLSGPMVGVKFAF